MSRQKLKFRSPYEIELKQTVSKLSRHYKLNEDDRTFEIALYYEKASDLFDENIVMNGKPRISDDVTDRMAQMLDDIPDGYKARFTLTIEDYGDYTSEQILEGINDALSFRHLRYLRRSKKTDLRTGFMMVVGVSLIVLMTVGNLSDITRSSKQKHRLTGGRMPIHRKKRKFEMGRQPSMTKLGEQKVVRVRGRGSGYKYRALKLNEGNFMWVSEGVSRKCKILEVLYNASNNELVRTQTLVKNCIVSVDPTPFKYYWYIHYSEVKINRLPEIKDEKQKANLDEKKNKKQKSHPKKGLLDKLNHFFELMNKGKLYACITSRPGQVGKADGYLLEGKELEFYLKKLEKKNK